MRLIKRALALFLVLLLSIESFAAVVSDNDGSAFITKAEFDSLKNDFQSQIDQYNTSIDSKIDGAIAAYLAGVRVSVTERIRLNLDKITDHIIFWTSSRDFAYHPNRPLFSECFVWGEYYLTTAFSLEYNKPFNSYNIETGTLKNGFFNVAECANWNDKFTQKCEYFFGGQDDQGYIGGRWPASSGWEGLRSISLSEQSGWGHSLWDISSTREKALAPDNTGGWRYANSYVSLSTLKAATTELVLAPFSDAETYVRDTGNEENQAATITGSANQSMDFASSYWGDIQDERLGTLQTKDPTTLSRTEKTNLWPNINGSGVSIPWLTKKYKVKKHKFAPLISVSGFDEPIEKGVLLYTTERDGKYDLTFTASNDGYGLFYVGPTAISNWGTPTSRVDGVNYVECTANRKTSFTIDSKKDDLLCFIYYPNDPEAIGRLTFDDAYFISE